MRLALPAAAVVALGALAACGAARPEAPRPLAAEVVRAVLVVHLTDGTRCVALTPFAAGSGAFGDCPGLTWRILPAEPAALRRVTDEGLALLAAGSLPAPGALVAVTDEAGGSTAFALPPPR